MSDDLISRSALLTVPNVCKVTEFDEAGFGMSYLAVPLAAINNAPAVDAVSPGVVEQYKWERDVAIGQLKELGIGFGQKKPDMVKVVRCKDCRRWGTGYGGETEKVKVCYYAGYMVGENGYCVYGERKMDGDKNATD